MTNPGSSTQLAPDSNELYAPREIPSRVGPLTATVMAGAAIPAESESLRFYRRHPSSAG